MSYLKDREIWLSSVPTGNPPAGYFWVFVQNGVLVVRDSNGVDKIMASTAGSITTAATASYVQYSNVANKPTLVSGSAQISFTGITNKPTLVSGSSQVTYSGLTGIPVGIVSGSDQIAGFGIFATTGSNQFNGSQAITGSLTVTGQVVAQTLNVQQVTSSIVYSSGSNIFGNSQSNTQQFTGSVSVTGSLAVAGALSGTSGTLTGALNGTTASFTGNVTSTSSLPRIISNTTSRYAAFNLYAAGSDKGGLVLDDTDKSVYLEAAGDFTYSLKFFTGANPRMTITPGGNVGIGVTPSSNWNTRSVIQLGAFGTSLSGYNGGGGATQLMHNVVANGFDFTYLNTGGATSYYMDGSDIVWGNAPSGTAGNAITFAERMRITSGGNLYVGNTDFTSPNGADKFIGVYGGQDASLILQDAVQLWELYVNDDFYITSGATPRLTINRTTGAATFSSSVTTTAGIFNLNTTDGGFKIVGVNATPTNLAYLANNYFPKFYTRNHNYGITIFDQSEATAIQSADLVNGNNARALIFNPYGGNVGIGTTSPDSGLTIEATSTAFNALSLRDTRAFNASPEAALAFRVKYNSAGAFATPSILFAYKDNATDGNQAGGIAFLTNGNAGPVERMRITSDGYLRMASGTGGIQFNGDTAAANALDDYEEGSWTPALQNATVSYSERSGSYVKIGNYVFVRWGLRISSISGQSGTVTISGLPFTAVIFGSYQEPNISVSTGVLATADNAQRARVYKGGGDTSLYGRIANNSDTAWTTSDLQNGSWIIGEIFYNV
jgi:hypothetical protein